MAILVKPDTKLLIQGITGEFGARHAKLSIDYGTQVVAGVTPGKGGQFFEHGGKKIPIFDTVAEAVKQSGATASAVFVPPPFAADAILEGVDAGLELVVAITEGLFLELKSTGSPVGASVLCPGFVKTNLMVSPQWQERLGAEPPATTSPMGEVIMQMLNDGVENGVDPDGIAVQVLEAILTERFWTLTHEDMRHLPVERMQRAAAQENPA